MALGSTDLMMLTLEPVKRISLSLYGTMSDALDPTDRSAGHAF